VISKRGPGFDERQAEGVGTKRVNPGRSKAWLLKAIEAAKANVPPPKTSLQVMTNLIR
jgi:hypothetical protein